MQIRFEDIPLEKPQKDVLAAMVEAERAVQPKDRQEFLLIGTMSGWFMHHAGLKRDEVYPGDLRELANWGLLRISYTSRGDEKFDVTGNGRLYYEWMKAQEGEPVEQVEAEVRARRTAARTSTGRWNGSPGDPDELEAYFYG